jgi:hypothetical protein
MGIPRSRIAAALTLGAAAVLAAGPGADVGPAPAATGAQAAGAIRGVARLSPPWAPDPITVTVDEAVCGRTLPDPSLAIGSSGGVRDVVVRVPGTTAGPMAAPAVVNRQCRFAPHVQLAPPKSVLRVTSEDKTLHTTHAYGRNDRSLFNVALLPVPGMAISRPLEDTGVIRLACDTHPWMRGFVVVTSELAAVSGEDGGFAIDGVPPGTYTLDVWHDRLKAPAQKVTVTAGATSTVEIVLSSR